MQPIATYPFGPSLVIERHRLENGLQILIVVDASAPVVAYQTWFAVGSRDERAGKTGISHLFEHLMFNETTNLPYGEYDRRLEEAGADNNAATYLDWTYYVINLPKEALAVAVELEAERMQSLVLRDAQVTSERDVVANERRETVDDDVDGALSELLYETAFDRHSYRFPTIGTMRDIEGITTADCQAFYETHYAPDSATLVIVGDVDREETLRRVRAAYGPMRPAGRTREEPAPEPEQREERRVRVEKPIETVRLALGYKSPAMADPDHVPVTLLNEVLFGGHGSRIHRALVEERELASDVAGFVGNFRDPSLWEMWIVGNEAVDPAELGRSLDELLAEVRSRPVTNDELTRACARLELSALQELETAVGKAEAIGFGELVLGDPSALLSRLEDYRSATVAELERVASVYLEPRRRTVIEVTPQRSS